MLRWKHYFLARNSEKLTLFHSFSHKGWFPQCWRRSYRSRSWFRSWSHRGQCKSRYALSAVVYGARLAACSRRRCSRVVHPICSYRCTRFPSRVHPSEGLRWTECRQHGGSVREKLTIWTTCIYSSYIMHHIIDSYYSYSNYADKRLKIEGIYICITILYKLFSVTRKDS